MKKSVKIKKQKNKLQEICDNTLTPPGRRNVKNLEIKPKTDNKNLQKKNFNNSHEIRTKRKHYFSPTINKKKNQKKEVKKKIQSKVKTGLTRSTKIPQMPILRMAKEVRKEKTDLV